MIYKGIRMPEKLVKKIIKLAEKNHRSFSNQVVLLLEKLLGKD